MYHIFSHYILFILCRSRDIYSWAVRPEEEGSLLFECLWDPSIFFLGVSKERTRHTVKIDDMKLNIEEM